MELTRTLALLAFTLFTSAQRGLNSTFDGTCMKNSQVTTIDDVFHVNLFDNGTTFFELVLRSTYEGNTTLGIEILEDGNQIYHKAFDPCSFSIFAGFCPLEEGSFYIDTRLNEELVPANAIPEHFYTAPELDAEFWFYVDNGTTADRVGCVKATLSNGAGTSNAIDIGNDTASSNSSDGSGAGGGSGAGTCYLNWTLLVSAMAVLAFSSSL